MPPCMWRACRSVRWGRLGSHPARYVQSIHFRLLARQGEGNSAVTLVAQRLRRTPPWPARCACERDRHRVRELEAARPCASVLERDASRAGCENDDGTCLSASARMNALRSATRTGERTRRDPRRSGGEPQRSYVALNREIRQTTRKACRCARRGDGRRRKGMS